MDWDLEAARKTVYGEDTPLDTPQIAPAPAPKTAASPRTSIDSLIEQEGASAIAPVIKAIYGQESGSGANNRTSVDGAKSGMQVIPSTFARFAGKGWDINNDEHGLRAGIRYAKYLGDKFGNDPAKIAAGYFSGEGNVPKGDGAFIRDTRDGNGKSVSGYVSDVQRRLGATPPAPAAPNYPKWAEVAAKPEFQSLQPDEQDAVRRQYFVENVAPRVPTDQLDDYWARFDADSRPKSNTERVLERGKEVLSTIASDLFSSTPKSVMDGYAPKGAPAENKSPVIGMSEAGYTKYREQFLQKTPEQLQRIAQQGGVLGQLATRVMQEKSAYAEKVRTGTATRTDDLLVTGRIAPPTDKERADQPISAADFAKDIWTAIKGAPTAVAGTAASLMEGSDPTEVFGKKDWKDTAIESARQQMADNAKDPTADAEYVFGITRSKLRNFPQQLSYSLLSMGAGLAAGLPTAAGVAATGVGAPAAPAAGYAAGAAAAGMAAYRMDTNGFLRDIRQSLDQASVEKRGKPLTDEEFVKVAEKYQGLVQKHGLYEALPEAASQVFGFALGKAIVKNAMQGGLGALARGIGAAGLEFGNELGTETFTQLGQHNTEVEAGTAGPNAKARSFTNLKDIRDSAAEVLPDVLMLTGTLAGGTHVGGKAYAAAERKLAPGRVVGRELQAAVDGTEFTKEGIDQAARDALSPAGPETVAPRQTVKPVATAPEMAGGAVVAGAAAGEPGKAAPAKEPAKDDLLGADEAVPAQKNPIAEELASLETGVAQPVQEAKEPANEDKALGDEIAKALEPAYGSGAVSVVRPEALPDRTAEVGGRRQLGKDEFADIEQLGNLFGKRVVLFDSTNDQHPDAFVRRADNGTIYLNTKAADAAHSVLFGHELDHLMEREAPEIHKAWREAVMAAAPELAQRAGEFYPNPVNPKTGKPLLTTEAHQAEIVADLMGNRFAEPEFRQTLFNNLAARSDGRTVLKKALEVIQNLIEKVKSLPAMKKFKADALVSDLKKVRREAARALGRYVVEQQKAKAAQAGVQESAKRVASTPEFKKWFGDSKVVDEKGEPLVVYHGNPDITATAKRQPSIKADIEKLKARRAEKAQASEKQEDVKAPAKRQAFPSERTVEFGEFKTGKPVTFDFMHNTESATDIFGKPKKGDQFKRDLEPSGRYVNQTSDASKVDTSGRMIAGTLTFNNPLVLDTRNWKQDLYDHYKKRGKQLSKALIDDGFDGVVTVNLDDRPNRSYVSEILDLTTFDEAKARYSAKRAPKEPELPDLIITHNLSAKNLLHAVRMGGIPVPSLAVTKKDRAIASFGEITLIGSKAMADPKGYAGTKVFGADIYSPRYPSVEYHLTPNMQKRLHATFAEGEKATGASVEVDEVRRDGARGLERSAAVMWQFLTARGVKPEIVMEKGVDEARVAWMKEHGLGEYLGRTDYFELANDDAFMAAAINAKVAEYTEAGTAEKRARTIQSMRDNTDDAGYYVARDYAREVADIAEKTGKPLKVDSRSTQYALEKQIREGGLQDDFEFYTDEALRDLSPNEKIFQGFTNSGNRKYIDHTLENVVKLLKKELRGGENFNYGVGSLRAKFTPQFKSIAQIKASKDRLITKDAFEKVKAEIDTEFLDVARALDPDASLDTITAVLEDGAKTGLARAAKEYRIEPSEEALQQAARFLGKLSSLPTEYFEAKILRDVDLAEFSGAVVPEGTGDNVLQALRSRGVKEIETYPRNDETARAEAVRGLAERLHEQGGDVLFSAKRTIEVDGVERPVENSEGRPIAKSDEALRNFWRWFGESKAVDWRGRPLVVFHGSPQGGFDEFDVSNVGAFFSNRYDIAASYAGTFDDVQLPAPGDEFYDENQGVYSTYLKLNNPLVIDWNGKSWGEGPEGLRLDDWAARAKREGRDGLVVENVVDTGWLNPGAVSDTGDGTVFVVFDPTAIKSATDNRGTFDPTNPGITASAQRDPSIVSQAIDRAIAREHGRRVPELSRESATVKLRALRRKLEDGKISEGQFIFEVEQLSRRLDLRAADKAFAAPAGRVRGADFVRQKMLEAKRNGDVSEEEADFLEWFVLKNPALLNDLGISVRSAKEHEKGAAGRYIPPSRVMVLMRGAGNPTTAVHEVLHHLERLMPADMQEAIREEWARAVASANAAAVKAGDKDMQRFTELVLTQGGRAIEETGKLLVSGKVPRSAYQLLNASEFWAVRMTDVAQRRFNAGSVWAKSLQWLREAVEHIKGALRLKSDAPMLRALNELLQNGDGKAKSKEMLGIGSSYEQPEEVQAAAKRTIEVDGVERPTENSKGQPIAKSDEALRNFWRWFGDGAFVDEAGRPLVLYHSTLDDKTVFDKHGKFMGYTGVSGISVTDSAEMASRYLDRYGNFRFDGAAFQKNVMAVYVNASNPLYRQEPFKTGLRLGAPLPTGYVSEVEKLGYDALVRDDAVSRKGGVKHSDAKNAIRGKEIVIFDPTGIKSATGNSGAFNPSNPDITASIVRKALDARDNAQRRLDAAVDGLSNLPDQFDYLRDRYRTLGRIARVDEITAEIRKGFEGAGAADKQAVYDYLTNAGASSAQIGPADLRSMAERLKKTINYVGDQLVARGLLDPAVRAAYKDQYLPRIYLKHLMSNQEWKILGAGKKPSDMGYLKERKNIPQEVRELILGEIKDPAFLGANAIGRSMRDIAILDWLGKISQNGNWVFPGVMVNFKGQQVSAYYLKAEADRIEGQIPHYAAANQAKAKQLVKDMRDEARAALGNLDVDHTLYKQIPDTHRYGLMRGLYVRKEIYNDVMGMSAAVNPDPTWFEKVFGMGHIGTRLTQYWKFTKVALNPPGQVRNFVSNMVMLQLSGIPLHKLPLRFAEAVRDIRRDGPYWKVAKKYGVTESTFNAQELYRIKDDMLSLEAAGRMNPISWIKLTAAEVFNKASDAYQFTEALGKTMKIIDVMKSGGTEEEAAIEAQKWLFDYSLVPQWARVARNSPVGTPFITYQLKVLPRLVEVATTAPWRLLPWVGLLYGMAYYVAATFGVGMDDLDKLKKALPEWLRDKGFAAFLPMKDGDGRVQVLDMSYFFPWTFYTDMGKHAMEGKGGKVLQDLAGMFSSPVIGSSANLLANYDSFTKKPIYNEADPPSYQAAAIANYIYDLMVPPIISSHGVASPMGLIDKQYGGKLVQGLTGTTNKFGDPRATTEQALWAALGVNFYGMDPEHSRATNLLSMSRKVQDAENRLKSKLYDRSLTEAQRAKAVSDYKERMLELGAEAKKYAEESQVPEPLKKRR